MPIRIVQLGTPRHRGEGVRIGTVRRPPRGVRKSQYAPGNWYDVWLPTLAPSAALMRESGLPHDRSHWKMFQRRYVSELKQPDQSHLLNALAALSRHASFSIGCYCSDERYCHRSILGRELQARGAVLAQSSNPT